MKIGVLTLQLKTNYGCLLQAFAMQKFLKSNGYDPITISHYNGMPFINKLLSVGKRTVLSFMGKNGKAIRGWMLDSEYKIISQNTQQFIDRYIRTTETVDLVKDRDIVKKYNLEALLVGSDQCWRPKTARKIEKLFFENYLHENIKKISYAASFGVSDWEYTKTEEEKCKKLIQEFDGVSVREDSAVKLCKDKFNILAEQVVDPTLLLSPTDYIQIIENRTKKPNSVMVYVLDQSNEKRKIIDLVKSKLGLVENSVMPTSDFDEVGKSNIYDCVFPPVEEWLNGFAECDYVVTDSFHGTVFALIFNKPFISIGNYSRGLTRFTSLLKLFELEDRLVNSSEEFDQALISKEIDFEKVNLIRNKQIEKAKNFINKNLQNE